MSVHTNFRVRIVTLQSWHTNPSKRENRIFGMVRTKEDIFLFLTELKLITILYHICFDPIQDVSCTGIYSWITR